MAELFDDPFTFMISEVNDADRRIEEHAGANNIFAANRAFYVILDQYPNRRFIVRQRGRIIKRSEDHRKGKGNDQQTQAPGTLP